MFSFCFALVSIIFYRKERGPYLHSKWTIIVPPAKAISIAFGGGLMIT